MEVGAKNRLGLPVTAVVMGEDHVEDIEIRTGGCLEGKTEWHEAVLTQIALMEIDESFITDGSWRVSAPTAEEESR